MRVNFLLEDIDSNTLGSWGLQVAAVFGD